MLCFELKVERETQFWTRKGRCLRMSVTSSLGRMRPVARIVSMRLTMAMKVPVRPTPAEQCTSTGRAWLSVN